MLAGHLICPCRNSAAASPRQSAATRVRTASPARVRHSIPLAYCNCGNRKRGCTTHSPFAMELGSIVSKTRVLGRGIGESVGQIARGVSDRSGLKAELYFQTKTILC